VAIEEEMKVSLIDALSKALVIRAMIPSDSLFEFRVNRLAVRSVNRTLIKVDERNNAPFRLLTLKSIGIGHKAGPLIDDVRCTRNVVNRVGIHVGLGPQELRINMSAYPLFEVFWEPHTGMRDCNEYS
jgi:hypothetical protein